MLQEVETVRLFARSLLLAVQNSIHAVQSVVS